MPDVTPVPRMPDYFLGVMNWRGKIIPCIDLRKRLGMPGAKEELDELAGLITARAADHMAWMEELYRSVDERRPFTLTTDPHACAFGRWYDSFQTTNLTVSALLRKMDAPHKAIHALAIRVENLKKEGKHDDAVRIVESARNTTLARLLELFSNFETALMENHRPVAVIVHAGGTLAAITVDSVEAVETIDPASVELLEESGRRKKLLERHPAASASAPRAPAFVGLVDESQILDIVAGASPRPPRPELPSHSCTPTPLSARCRDPEAACAGARITGGIPAALPRPVRLSQGAGGRPRSQPA